MSADAAFASATAELWDLGNLPFHIGARESPSNAPFPDVLPFVLGVETSTGVLVQVANDDVGRALMDVYQWSSQIGTPLSDDGLGRRYLDDFLAFVESALGDAAQDASVLEIGCGNGALLSQLSDRVASVVGVEPGSAAAAQARSRGLEILEMQFDLRAFSAPFDAIVHYGVLEHLDDPVSFLSDQLKLLTPSGVVVCSVPDSTKAIAAGDISMLVHEHWSYFTAESLTRVAERAGGHVVKVEPAEVGGAIRAVIVRTDREVGLPRGELDEAAAYKSRARESVAAIGNQAVRLQEAGSTLGVYPAARFINYHALVRYGMPTVRYFDDDQQLIGSYYPPSTAPVESRDMLVREPVDELWITSWSFGDAIARQLNECDALRGTRVRLIAELLHI
jgi:SAM-dependent methyltransferase